MTYTVRAEEADRRHATATTDELDDAVQAAWTLQRYLEGPVEIVDDDDDRVIGRLELEWFD